MVFGCFAGARERGIGCLRLWVLDCTFRTRLWMLDCTLSLGLQKVTLEAGFLTSFGT